KSKTKQLKEKIYIQINYITKNIFKIFLQHLDWIKQSNCFSCPGDRLTILNKFVMLSLFLIKVANPSTPLCT
ncbi:hypothetical protein BpHYR1_042718, partial [Brachionus plicatilis]